MKKLFGLMVIATLTISLLSCEDGNDTGTVQFTIRNESSYELVDVLWNNDFFASNQTDNSLKPGTSATMTVQAGTGFIRYRPTLNPINFRTNEVFVITKGEQREFIFLNNTIVVNESNNISGTLGSFSGVPLITVRQGTTDIKQFGEFDFGNVTLDTVRELTFTIENAGGANLTFETVIGNRINLTDNASGFFSVNMQPLAPIVTPGNSATFNVQFNPTIAGNNFSTTVNIKTDCHLNDEFIFRLRGNVTIVYQIGDTGPAGGIVFFDAGAVMNGWRYLEASLVSFTAEWGRLHVGNTATSIGSGKENTQRIVNALNQAGQIGRAAQLCADLDINGFNDWFLPSIDELNQIFLRRSIIGGFDETPPNNRYWSSTQSQYDSSTSWSQFFNTGNQNPAPKDFNLNFRAIRAF